MYVCETRYLHGSMINLKNLKSLFIVTEEENPEASKTEENSVPVSNTTTPATKVVTPNTSGGGIYEDRIAESLFEALEKNNLEGFDYFEFKNSLKALSQMPLDEATRFRSAFATASTMGLTVDKLLQTADHYLKILGKEHVTFSDVVSQQKESNITGREQEIERLNKMVQDKSEQIKLLTEEIQKHQADVQKTREEITLAKTRIEQAEANFKSTYTAVVTQMTDDVTKIKQYLISPK